nr:SusC/RagA family TonB-linked outer membrane protein [Chitinophagaceae bacterium]
FGTQNKFQNTYDFGSNVNTSNSLQKSSSRGNTLLNNYTLTFDHAFGNHNINALIGYEQISSSSDGIDVRQSDQALQPNYSFFQTSASQTFNPTGTFDANGLIKSQFARLNYNYNNIFYFSGAIRRDADFTKFGPGNQYGIFPSASASWRITQSPFIQRMDLVWLDELKLRGSYGVIGNSNIPSYYFLSSYQTVGAQNFTADGTRNIGVGQTNLPNSNIKWESLYETNIGLDAEFLNHKLFATVEYYDKTTKNVLYAIPIPLSAGLGGTFQTNIGSVKNKGVEVVLGYQNRKGRLGYSISVNGAFNKNKVVSLYGNNTNPFYDGSTDIGGGYGIMTGNAISSTQAGRSFAEFFGYQTEGIYSTQKQINDHPQFVGDTAMLGDLIFKDVNKDGILSADDRTLIGNPNPKLIYGININLNWKGFDVALLFNGVSGVKLFNGVKAYAQDIFSDGNTTSDVFGAAYLGSNQLTSQPRIGYFQTATSTFIKDPNGNYSKPNSYFVENGSYLKLKNLQMGYTFSGQVINRLHMQSARLFVMGNNLFTITKYSGLDPELSGSVTAHGIDNANAYPHTRIYTVGFDLNF